jgi:hypothetical protein
MSSGAYDFDVQIEAPMDILRIEDLVQRREVLALAADLSCSATSMSSGSYDFDVQIEAPMDILRIEDLVQRREVLALAADRNGTPWPHSA